MMEIEDFWDKWNAIHCKEIKKGAQHRNTFCADWCEQQILEAKKAYYNGNPIMNDACFDKIEDMLKILRPNSYVLSKVGTSEEA